jgi:hypothetical protein
MGVALHSEELAYFATSWQGFLAELRAKTAVFGGFPQLPGFGTGRA